MVQLTEAGAAKVDAALIDLLAHERTILVELGEDDAELLATLLRRVLAPFDHPGSAPTAAQSAAT
jgi:DNA-binding MarR family transcriptional regulator